MTYNGCHAPTPTGNGDILSFEDYNTRMSTNKFSGLLIGRWVVTMVNHTHNYCDIINLNYFQGNCFCTFFMTHLCLCIYEFLTQDLLNICVSHNYVISTGFCSIVLKMYIHTKNSHIHMYIFLGVHWSSRGCLLRSRSNVIGIYRHQNGLKYYDHLSTMV